MGIFSGLVKGRDGAYTPKAEVANAYGKSVSKGEKRVEAASRAGAKGSPKNAKSN